MSIDLEKAYFKKLEKYVGKKINIVSNENEINYEEETSKYKEELATAITEMTRDCHSLEEYIKTRQEMNDSHKRA